ncbi:MAG: hypothetical protein ACPGES_04730 [Coraliomargarita sp.]
MSTLSAETDAEVVALLKKMEQRIAELEAKEASEAQSGDDAMAKRIAELEARLAEQEQETKEVKVLASAGSGSENGILGNAATFDILANSAWRNLRWTEEDQWAGIQKGITQEKVVELLGAPPRTVKSLKPRVDEVYFYETSIRDHINSLNGRISFKKGKVISFTKPDFSSLKKGQ